MIDCFRALKQRVIWKYDNDSLADLPSNVLIEKWLPQSDILAHPNIILFISHGGVFGTVESIWHGVPMIMMPFFGDQHRNAMRAVRAGYGKYLPFFSITNETLMDAVQEFIVNKKYSDKTQEISSIFKANPVSPMDETMFWIEYVVQFSGAPHLKSHATNMFWFSYLLLDVLFVPVGLVLIFVLLVRKLCCCCWRRNEIGKKKNE